jgi:hypothetical protein
MNPQIVFYLDTGKNRRNEKSVLFKATKRWIVK